MSEPPFLSPHEQPWTNRRILLLLALGTLIVSIVWRLPAVAGYALQSTGEIFFTFVLAATITYLLRPLVNALCRTRFFGGAGNGSGSRAGRMWATTLVFVVCIALLALGVSVGLHPLKESWNSFFAQDEAGRLAMVEKWRAAVQSLFDRYQGLIPDDLAAGIQHDFPDWLITAKQRGAQWLSHSFSHLGFIIELLLVPVLVFYFLTDGAALRDEARLLLPAAWRPSARRMGDHFDRVFDGFIRGQVIMCLIAWLLVTATLLVLRVPYAFLLGVVAGLTRAIPIIGPILGGIPLIVVCFIATRSMQTTLLLLAGFTAMHFLESKVLLPKIVGHEVDLHPVSVILALLLGMEFFGFLGVFLAVPIAALAKIVLTEYHARTRETETHLIETTTIIASTD
jgi:predicted PurR-regulated permease PerM